MLRCALDEDADLRVRDDRERGPVIVLCFSLFSTLSTLPFFAIYYHPMSPYQLGYLLAAGLSAAVAQLNITAAYTYAPASAISVFDYTQVIFAAILGVLLPWA